MYGGKSHLLRSQLVEPGSRNFPALWIEVMNIPVAGAVGEDVNDVWSSRMSRADREGHLEQWSSTAKARNRPLFWMIPEKKQNPEAVTSTPRTAGAPT